MEGYWKNFGYILVTVANNITTARLRIPIYEKKIHLQAFFSLKFFQMGHHIVISERKCIHFQLLCPKTPSFWRETHTCKSYGQKSALSRSPLNQQKGKDQRTLFSERDSKGKCHAPFQPMPSSNSCLIPEAKLGTKILHQQLETSMYTKPSWSSAAACL